MTKNRPFPDGMGMCILPVSSEDDLHLFGLFDKDNNEIDSGYFSSLERALETMPEEYKGKGYTIKDLDEEWLLNKGMELRDRIKKLCPSIKKSGLTLDLSELYCNHHNPNIMYTFVPFEYKGTIWHYREHAGEDWVEKYRVKESKGLESLIETAATKAENKNKTAEPLNIKKETLDERV